MSLQAFIVYLRTYLSTLTFACEMEGVLIGTDMIKRCRGA